MQISEHVHALRIPFQVPVGPNVLLERFVYVLLVYAREICLVDTGVRGAEKIIYDYLTSTGRSPDQISRVVLTHSHPDHVGSAASIVRATGASVYAHAAERAWIEDVERQGRERPIPGFASLVAGSVPLTGVLNEGDFLDLGEGLGLEVLHTPGHSPGSVSLLLRTEGVLMVGDAVPLPTDYPIYVDARASMRSLHQLAKLDGIGVLLSAWDEPRRGDESRRVFEAALRHLERIHAAVWAGAAEEELRDPAQVTAEVFARLGTPQFGANPLTVQTIRAHLHAGPGALSE